MLRWLGRFIGRLHAVGATAPFEHRVTLDVATYGEASRDFLLERRLVSDDVAGRWRALADAGARRLPRAPSRPPRRAAPPARRLPPGQRPLDRRRPALRRPRRRRHRPRGAGPVDAAVGRPRRDDAPARSTCSRATKRSWTSTGASCAWSSRCARCACSTTAPGSRGAGATRRSRSTSRGSRARRTGPTSARGSASSSRRWPSRRWRRIPASDRGPPRGGTPLGGPAGVALRLRPSSSALTRRTYAAGSSSWPPSASSAWSNRMPARSSKRSLDFEPLHQRDARR